MKMIDCDAPFYCHEDMWLITYIPEYSPERLTWFYYRLGEFVIYGFLNEALSLGGGYFNESN